MNKQRGGRVRVVWLALIALVATVTLYATASTAPAAAPPVDDTGIVHSFPNDDSPPPCGAFDSICYMRIAISRADAASSLTR
jgi:hypothetical protein